MPRGKPKTKSKSPLKTDPPLPEPTRPERGKRAKDTIHIPYTPRPLQKQFHNGLKRFSVAVCHRRFGKTVMAINELLKRVVMCPHPRAQGAYIAPTYSAAKRIAWVYLKHYAGVIPGVKFNEAELRVDLPMGKKIYLLGAENPDSLRGMFLDAVVLDEYADMNSRLYPEVIRPALADRLGYCLWIGTPRGENQFKEVYDYALQKMEEEDPDWYAVKFPASLTGVLDASELAAARDMMDESQYDQEFECSWTAALVGAYYARQLDKADADKRIRDVPYDPAIPVTVAMDLGVADATAMWFVQQHHAEIRVLDYYEGTGEGLQYYVNELRNRNYVYNRYIFPHDVLVRELGSGMSRYEILQGLGIRPSVVHKVTVADGIEAVRSILPRCYFDRDKCRLGIRALRQYHREWDNKRNDWRDRPHHDWSSHGSDAFRYLALGLRDDTEIEVTNMARHQKMPDGRPLVDAGVGMEF